MGKLYDGLFYYRLSVLVSFANFGLIIEEAANTVSDRSAAMFTTYARVLVLKVYFSLSAFSATICSWFGMITAPTVEDVAETLQHYTNSS